MRPVTCRRLIWLWGGLPAARLEFSLVVTWLSHNSLMACRSVIVRQESCWQHLSVDREMFEPLLLVDVIDDFLNRDEVVTGLETSSLPKVKSLIHLITLTFINTKLTDWNTMNSLDKQPLLGRCSKYQRSVMVGKRRSRNQIRIQTVARQEVLKIFFENCEINRFTADRRQWILLQVRIHQIV